MDQGKAFANKAYSKDDPGGLSGFSIEVQGGESGASFSCACMRTSQEDAARRD